MATCTACRGESPEGARFCPGCGAALAANCRACGTPLAPQARFCAECGHAVGGEVTEKERPLGDGERRQLTVLFCDLVGSTELSASLDPEDYRALLRGY